MHTTGARLGLDQDPQVDHHGVQRHDGAQPARGAAVGGAGREKPAVSLLMGVAEGSGGTWVELLWMQAARGNGP